MKQTFEQYVEFKKQYAPLIVECAKLVAEQEDDPLIYLENKIRQEYPLFDAYLTEAGFWKGVGDAAKSVWGGMKQGWGHMANTWNGPQAQFGSAIKALTKLTQIVQNNAPDAQTTGTSTMPSMPLGQWLSDTIKELQSQQTQLPQFQTQQQTNYTQPQRPDQNVPFDPNASKYPPTPTP